MQKSTWSASTVYALLSGLLVALALAVVSIPLLNQATALDEEQAVARLELVARFLESSLSGDELHDGLAPVAVHDRLEQAVLLGPLELGALVGPDGDLLAMVNALAEYPDLDVPLSACTTAATDPAHTRPVRWRVGSASLRGVCRHVTDARGDVYRVLLAASQAPQPGLVRAGRFASLLLLFGSCAAVLVVTVGMKVILDPLTEIGRQAERLSHGERGIRVSVRGPAEVRALATALNALTSSLEEREEANASRLQTVSRFAGTVAHEVRNPLQGLALLANLAADEPDPGARQELLTSIEEEVHGLEQVVQGLLRTSGPVQIHPSEVLLGPIIQQAIQVAMPAAAEAGVTLLRNSVPSEPVRVDGSLLRKVLENVLLNAVQALTGRSDGQVRLTVDRPEIAGTPYLVLAIDDNGPGVPVADRVSIFDPFVSSRAGGTGIGLSFARQVIEAHQGTVECLSSELGGARFLIRIPQPRADTAR